MISSASATSPAAALRAEAWNFETDADTERVVSWLGDTPVVLLGEASHGTQEFYAARARLTRMLIERQGFTAVAVEGDWPDAYQVNRYVQGGGEADAASALAGFRRFPAWMWRNTEVAGFIAWLRRHNEGQPARMKAGFYGLDLYSLRSSMRAVVDYLEQHDPRAAREARASYACFDQFGREADTYAWATGRLGAESCEEAVTRELIALHQRRGELLRRDGQAAAEDFFHAEQNARLARNAERYYRTMVRGRVASWNIRDEHMAETLAELLEHLQSRGQAPKVVVWAHNSHLGDARATELSEIGELNLGQLARQRYGTGVRSIGFTTYAGTVAAASDWEGEMEVKRVRPALAGSFEDLFHATERPSFFLPLEPGSEAHGILWKRRLERAIGVVYRPETERQSHYFEARLAGQFDAVIHLDETRALIPLDLKQVPAGAEPPETFPEGT